MIHLIMILARRGVLGLALLLAITSLSEAQILLHDLVGDTPDFSLFVKNLGDVDTDGVSDFAVAEPDFVSPTAEGRVFVYSGATGAVLSILENPPGVIGWGSAISAAGDVNGDGRADIMVFAGMIGHRVYDALDGTLLMTPFATSPNGFITGGVGVGDLNADGKGDTVHFAGFGANSQGSIAAISGGDGQVLYFVDGPVSGGFFGSAIEPLSDVNGDGVPDFVVGAGGATIFSNGHAYILSGADGSFLHIIDGPGAGSQFGRTLTRIRDSDGDMICDVAIMAAGGPAFFTFNPLGGAGQIYVHSGATGGLIHVIDLLPGEAGGNPWQGFGLNHPVFDAGDIDGDGRSDVGISAVFVSGLPGFTIHSTLTGEPLAGLNVLDALAATGMPGIFSFASDAAGLGDLDGDGFAEVLVRSNLATTVLPPVPGHAFVYSLRIPGVESFGAPSAPLTGPPPHIGASGTLASGGQLTINVSNVPAAADALLAVGTSSTTWGAHPLPMSLTAAGAPGGELLVSLDVCLFSQTQVIGPHNAWASWTSVVFNDPPAVLAGLVFFAQGFVVDPMGGPGAFVASRGLRLTFP